MKPTQQTNNMAKKDTPKQVEYMVAQALKDAESWLMAHETFMMSFSTLKASPSFIRVCAPFVSSKLHDKSPLALLPKIEAISRRDPEEVTAQKKEKNTKTREERDKITHLELERVFPILKKVALAQRCKIVRQRDSITIAK
jgi:hypothetical protein